MKEPNHFSAEAQEKTSLNFLELRQKGLDYIQELSGDSWTDYNSHDPGVTILEQICYALTDVSFRTNYKINDLLIPKNKKIVDSKKNGFYAPSEIYRTHPVTVLDVRKAIIDNFDCIQNVWITTADNSGFEEKLVITKKIEILPKSNYKDFKKLKNKVTSFVARIRNIGEDVDEICVLKSKDITIKFDIHLSDQKNIESTLANLFLALFEYVYSPVAHHSFKEMMDDNGSVVDIFSGPKLSNGFIKDDSLKNRLTTINSDEIKQLLTKNEDILKCVIHNIYFESDNKESKKNDSNKKYILTAPENMFFNLFEGTVVNDLTIENFERLYENINIKINDKELKPSPVLKQKTHLLFYELRAKKYRQEGVKGISKTLFKKDLQGTYQNVEDYFSIQNHFPLIYGIGKEGLPSNVPQEAHAKAKQLKAYLLFFEQHLANQLSQISHIDAFFNINFEDEKRVTYFSQDLDQVPNIEGLLDNNYFKKTKEKGFYDKKNRIYNHLLARFGEDLKPIPRENSYFKKNNNEQLFETEKTIKDDELERKSNYLKNIGNLSAERIKGEDFSYAPKGTSTKRNISGLENIILSKTGIPPRDFRAGNVTKSDNNKETFYIVDHILLRDFLNDNDEVFGFKFVNAKNEELCSTKAVESWSKTKEARMIQLNKLYEVFRDSNENKRDDNFLIHEVDAPLKSLQIKARDSFKTLATFANNYNKKAEVMDLMHLFDKKLLTNGRSRLREIEKIRAKGIAPEKDRGKNGQRRLVFERKIKAPFWKNEPDIIDEDFFNLSISIILPKTTRRFQDEQFKHYMEDLIIERVPSHIHVNRLWVSEKQMSSFKKVYHKWENLKVSSDKKSKELKKASYDVYIEIINLKKDLDEAESKNLKEKKES